MEPEHDGANESAAETKHPGADETSSRKTPHRKKEKTVHPPTGKVEEELERLRDRYLRCVAELDNYRKRTEKERIQLIQSANAELIKQLLPIVDDFERSLKVPAQGDSAGFRDGVELIHQKLNTLLRAQGVETMETIGQPFDVERHDALLHVENSDFPQGTVAEEVEKGYMLNQQVLRHAKVLVSKGNPEGGSE
jgi:molecular chaperone GrpE